jgi:ankyrin repeat protein
MSKELEAAVTRGDVDAMRAAIAAAPKVAPKQMSSLLYSATRNNRPEILRLLLERYKPRIGWSVLGRAVTDRQLPLLQLLKDFGGDLNLRNELNGMSPIHYCASVADAEYLAGLHAMGADFNFSDNSGETPFLRLVRELPESFRPDITLAALHKMVELGADATRKDVFGNTALDFYRFALDDKPEDPAFVAWLTSLGVTDTPATSHLFAAVEKEDLSALIKAIAAGGEVNRQSPSHEETALCIAASNGNLKVVDLLLKAGADPNKPNRTSRPLIRAAEGGHLDIVKRLIEAGADPLLRHPIAPASDCDPMTPYEAAVNYRHKQVAAHLKSIGAHRTAVTTIAPGARLSETFSEILINAPLKEAADALAKFFSAKVISSRYGAAIRPGPRAWLLAQPKKTAWCNLFQVVPNTVWHADRKSAEKLAGDIAKAVGVATRFIGYSDTSDAAAAVLFSPDGTSKRKNGKESENDWLERLAAKEKFVAGMFGPLAEDGRLEELAIAGQAADAFAGIALLST